MGKEVTRRPVEEPREEDGEVSPDGASPPPGDSRDVTGLLRDWKDGRPGALEKLLPLVYDDLRERAKSYLRRERKDHTLQPTAVVNELYLKLAGDRSLPTWQDRAHFLAVASRVMRRVLIDHARLHNAQKRGGDAVTVCLDEAYDQEAKHHEVDVLALDEALERLADLDPRQAKIVELRFFGGLSIRETAAVLEVSPPVVVRETRSARAWLYHMLRDPQQIPTDSEGG